MFEMNETPNEPAQDVIIDGGDATFMADVIEASQTMPVIVDFWATWCGPCKTLGPAIESAVKAKGGAVRLVKIDVDQNQAVAGQMRVQSIPTVYAFWQGQPVDGFQGAVPPSEVTAFVDKVAALTGDGGLSEAVEAAEMMLEEGDAAGAAQTFAAILQEDPNNAPAYGGLARAYVAAGQVDEAEAVLNGAPAGIADAQELEAAHAQIALARQAENAGPVDTLSAAVEANPDDQQARFDLANALQAAGQTDAAVDQLLELFRRDRAWNDEAAKTQLFQIFDALKPNDPVVLNGRRKLSSMIFL